MKGTVGMAVAAIGVAALIVAGGCAQGAPDESQAGGGADGKATSGEAGSGAATVLKGARPPGASAGVQV